MWEWLQEVLAERRVRQEPFGAVVPDRDLVPDMGCQERRPPNQLQVADFARWVWDDLKQLTNGH